nr:MAG TPA: hypothetical protein [Caudoviricetes sp.]
MQKLVLLFHYNQLSLLEYTTPLLNKIRAIPYLYLYIHIPKHLL